MGKVENGVTVSSTVTNDECENFPMNTNKLRKKNSNNWGPKRFEKKNHVIKLMV